MSDDHRRFPVIRVFDCHVARQGAAGYEFLLLERAPGKIYAGSWRMVGGKLRDGETAWQACLREIREETALEIVDLFVVPYVNRFYEWEADRINDIPVFVALTEGAEPKLDAEHVRFEWLSAEDAVERLPWPGQREGLRAAERLLYDESPLRSFLTVDPAR